MIRFKHTICRPYTNKPYAHTGDLMYSLSYIKSFGTSAELALVCEDSLYNEVRDLIMHQPYIEDVVKYKDQKIDIDLDRSVKKEQELPLLDGYYRITGDVVNHDPWLTCSYETTVPEGSYNLIYRNTNYRNRLFDWKYFVEQNVDLSTCYFVGSDHEYTQFLMNIRVPPRLLKRYKTHTLTRLLSVINKCEHFYCSAGLPLVLAHGLGTNMTAENGARMPNSGHLSLAEYMSQPINKHIVLNRENCIYYEQYNGNKIETV